MEEVYRRVVTYEDNAQWFHFERIEMNMLFDINLRIDDLQTGIGMDIYSRLEVRRINSAIYEAFNMATLPVVVVGRGNTAHDAILDYISKQLHRDDEGDKDG